MYILDSQLTFITQTGTIKYTIDYVKEVNTEVTWDTLISKAQVDLPNNFYLNNEKIYVGLGSTNTIFQRGDKVNIQLGYLPNLNTVFDGFISKIQPYKDNILHIEVSDANWLAQQAIVSKFSTPSGSTGITLKQLFEQIRVQDILWNVEEFYTNKKTITYKLLSPDSNVGTWAIPETPLLAIFERLTSTFGLKIWVENNVIIVGTPMLYQFVDALDGNANFISEHKEYTFYLDGPDCNVVSHNLEYRKSEDFITVVKGVLWVDNKKKDVLTHYVRYLHTPGNKDTIEVIEDAKWAGNQQRGNLITKQYFSIPIAELDENIKRVLKTEQYTGLIGSFRTFGQPQIKINDIISFQSVKYPELSNTGKYYVKKVSTSFNLDGFFQDIEIQYKYAE